MAKRKRTTPKPAQVVSYLKDVTTSIRLTGALNREAREVMELTGLSLNALISVALADYLKERGRSVW